MRRYQPIWIQLLEKKKLVIRCSPDAMDRIIRMVHKEKDMDNKNSGEWRLESMKFIDEGRIFFKLRHKIPITSV